MTDVRQAPACVNCSRLGGCSVVTVSMLLTNQRCDQWEQNQRPEEVVARISVLQKFGESAAKALIEPPEGV